MPARGYRKSQPPIGNPTDPEGLGRAVVDYLASMRVRNYSEATIHSRSGHLARLVTWLDERGVTRLDQITPAMLTSYQRYLAHARKVGKGPMSARTQALHLSSIRKFCAWATKTRHLSYNPGCDIELPRIPNRIPRATLTHEEAEQILAVCDTDTLMGVRDRAILEVFYATGVRRTEVTRLALGDLDLTRRMLFIREGKGAKDRIVPLGERAAWWVEKYLEEVRPHYAGPIDSGALFITHDGEPITPNTMGMMVRQAISDSGVDKPGSCHLFRHTMATLMLDGGADIRFIQEMLGHSSIKSTQIYTRVAIEKLAKVHAATHPGALLPTDHDAEESTVEN